MTMDKTAVLKKLSESLLMTIRQDMEAHPDQYAAEKPPSHDEVVSFLQQQSEDPMDNQNYQMKMAEAIKRRLGNKRRLLDE